jgi:hypothetical protein
LDAGRWLATLKDGRLTLDRLGGTGAEPVRDVFTMPKACDGVPELAASLHSLGSVVRFRHADLWDAIGTSIIRQVIRAGQSKKRVHSGVGLACGLVEDQDRIVRRVGFDVGRLGSIIIGCPPSSRPMRSSLRSLSS